MAALWEPDGLIPKKSSLWLMTRQFQVSILTTRITYDFGAQGLITLSILIDLTLVTTMVPSKRESKQSTSQVYSIPMTQQMPARSWDLSSNTSSAQPLCMTSSRGIKRNTMTNLQISLILTRYSWTIPIQLFPQLNFWEFSLTKKCSHLRKLGTWFITRSPTPTTRCCQRHWRSGAAIWLRHSCQDIWIWFTWSTISILIGLGRSSQEMIRKLWGWVWSKMVIPKKWEWHISQLFAHTLSMESQHYILISWRPLFSRSSMNCIQARSKTRQTESPQEDGFIAATLNSQTWSATPSEALTNGLIA